MTAYREMPKYQCHKQVWALKIKAIGEGSSNSEFAILQFEEAGYGPLPVSADWHFKHKPEPGGYYVVYEDGYKSYSPASAFESGYSLSVIDPGPDTLEREIQAKANKAPRVTPADIENEIASVHYFVASDAIQHENATHEYKAGGWLLGATQQLTFCVIQMRNGFTVTGENACVSPLTFDADLGRKYAREKAIEKVWELLGFRLKDKLVTG